MLLEHKTLGNRIRVLRKQAKLTQADIAKELGISRSLVAHWETDRPGRIFAHLPQLAKVLKVELSDFLYTIKESKNNHISDEEKYIITEYNKMDVIGRIRIQRFIQRMSLSKDFFEE